MKKIRHFYLKLFFVLIVVSVFIVLLAIFWSNLYERTSEDAKRARRPVDLRDY
jgi:hypothetical protein